MLSIPRFILRSVPRSAPRSARALALVLATASTACSPTLDWRDTQFPEADGALALFPCKPDRVTRRVRLAGDAVTFALASCSAGKLTFAFGHVEMADAGRIPGALNELAETAAANVGSPVRALPAARVAGAAVDPPARHVALLGRRPDGGMLQEEALFFAKGRRIYQASVVGASVDPETAETCFSGFKLPD